MRLNERILYQLVKMWRSPVRISELALGKDPSSDEYHMKYAILQQFDIKVRYGLGFDIRDKVVLEIGCGHGGISCFIALNGAKSVTGVDINDRVLEIAEVVKNKLIGEDRRKSIEFKRMSATQLEFPDDSLDLVIADNVFEHFSEPEKVIKECYRVLKVGGILSVGSMPSYYSRHGLHLKHALKIPWANLLFSEKTICNVVIRRVKDEPSLQSIYPGVVNNPIKVRDLRAHRDLNGMTYSRFRKLAYASGFAISSFRVVPVLKILGKIVQHTPFINKTILSDIFSSKVTALLIKK